MPNKKITVVGDGAEEPLSPEEEHQIEVRVDQMLDPALPDGTSIQPVVAPPAPAPIPAPELQPAAPTVAETVPEPQPEPKKVTKIVTKFADDDDEAEPAAPAAALPEPEAPKPKPVPAAPKPAGKKISVIHADDDDDEPEKPKPKTTKAAAPKAKKSKKSETKDDKKDAPDNLETKADAITAAALAAAEAIDTKHEEPAIPEQAETPAEDSVEPTEPESETSVETPDLPANDTEPADDALGAPPLIQKHSVSPIGAETADDETASDEPLPPSPTKQINIVDNTSSESAAESTDTDSIPADEIPAVDEPTDETTEEEPATTELAATEASEPADIETPEPAASETPAESTDDQTKKYRPPEGPIQFKRAEVPIEPLKPGAPRPAEASDVSSEDAALAEAFEVKEPKAARKPLNLSIGKSLKKLSLVVVLVIVAAVVALVAVPTLRNKALGLVGATADMQVTVRDASNNTPLWNVLVVAGGARGYTSSQGTVTLHGVKLGDQQLTAKANVFADKSQPVTIGWHSQNATSLSLVTTGTHYGLTLVDYLSGQPVADAKVSSNGDQTISNAKGLATLVAPSSTISVEISASSYIRQTTALTSGATKVRLVPAGQDVYISRSGGKFSVYRNSVDGTSEQLVLSGAGTTATGLALAPNSSGDTAALVSTRDNTHDSSGNLQDSLSIISTANGSVSVIDHADTIKLVDWFGNRLVYVLSKTTTSTTDPDRYQLISYDADSKKSTLLDHAAYLNDVVSAKGAIYYATAANGSAAGQFISMKPDGTGKKVILGSEIAAITRPSFSQLALASVSKWYSYRLGDAKATQTATANTATGRHYVDSPDGALSVYVDTTASTPKLVLYNTKTGKESLLAQAAGITYPVHWLGNGTIIYRVSHGGVVTDNATTPSGGNGQVVANVSDIAGISLWHE